MEMSPSEFLISEIQKEQLVLCREGTRKISCYDDNLTKDTEVI